MTFTEQCNSIFRTAVADYHRTDNVDALQPNPYPAGTIEHALYEKNWIDTVQWHLEDIIRDPHINPDEALAVKRRIDRSNQDRTDLVEQIDTYFLRLYEGLSPLPDARLNTESPAWAIDRLSILHVKLWHMREQTCRTDASEEHLAKCRAKLAVLTEQLTDLSTAISQLLDDYQSGRRVMKVYRQMKMYNDPTLNPVLYKQ
ncbi:MAG: DUF4254 domain-containing protein [Paludibacteraceae bacterium]|nr:DUF4254 domain-containing protein [Paludibacteraceae bacterium]MBQ9705682.1 DUF4254 domain-containing protein [Paludibacteraceae bacterium]